jgi:hypothetical protein
MVIFLLVVYCDPSTNQLESKILYQYGIQFSDRNCDQELLSSNGSLTSKHIHEVIAHLNMFCLIYNSYAGDSDFYLYTLISSLFNTCFIL